MECVKLENFLPVNILGNTLVCGSTMISLFPTMFRVSVMDVLFKSGIQQLRQYLIQYATVMPGNTLQRFYHMRGTFEGR